MMHQGNSGDNVTTGQSIETNELTKDQLGKIIGLTKSQLDKISGLTKSQLDEANELTKGQHVDPNELTKIATYDNSEGKVDARYMTIEHNGITRYPYDEDNGVTRYQGCEGKIDTTYVTTVGSEDQVFTNSEAQQDLSIQQNDTDPSTEAKEIEGTKPKECKEMAGIKFTEAKQTAMYQSTESKMAAKTNPNPTLSGIKKTTTCFCVECTRIRIIILIIITIVLLAVVLFVIIYFVALGPASTSTLDLGITTAPNASVISTSSPNTIPGVGLFGDDSTSSTIPSTSTVPSTITTTQPSTTVPICDVQASSCPNGWTTWESQCYMFERNDNKKFHNATAYCKTLHPLAHLVSIQTRAELDYVSGQMYPLHFWTGGYKDGGGLWRWKYCDNDKSNPLLPTDLWMEDEPNNSNGLEDYVHVDGGHKAFNDVPEYYVLSFACEINL